MREPLVRDFLSLTEEKLSSYGRGDVYRIGRVATGTDDFAQAVNMACVTCWYRTKKWADIMAIARKLNLDYSKYTISHDAMQDFMGTTAV